jgi:hypothetical protein
MPKPETASGYVPCACRDCMELAITDHGEPVLCSDCEEAGCEAGVEQECQSPNAYGCGENEPEHTKDADCTLDVDMQCIVCGVSHSSECPQCHGRGFHRPNCPEFNS